MGSPEEGVTRMSSLKVGGTRKCECLRSSTRIDSSRGVSKIGSPKTGWKYKGLDRKGKFKGVGIRMGSPRGNGPKKNPANL